MNGGFNRIYILYSISCIYGPLVDPSRRTLGFSGYLHIQINISDIAIHITLLLMRFICAQLPEINVCICFISRSLYFK